MFIDEVVIMVKGGKGGNGRISFRREKFEPRGGPDGGDGGRGGNVVLLASHNTDTLSSYRSRKSFSAQDGGEGGGKRLHGADGTDLLLTVPVGTVVADATGRVPLFDFTRERQEWVAAAGGRGGYGNAHFTSSVRQAPKFAEYGDEGETRSLALTLKLVADVGIIGLPNAGKSTLISRISAARPKIADYPFTTLVPNLGIVTHKGRSFTVSDNPGLIEGAARGKGLGIRFLKHVERTRILLHLIDCTAEEALKDIRTVRKELRSYGKALSRKPIVTVLTKAELLDAEALEKVRKGLEKKLKSDVYAISSVTGLGLSALLDHIVRELAQAPPSSPVAKEAVRVYRPDEENSRHFEARKKGKAYVVTGKRIEQIVRMSELSNPEALERVYDVLTKMNITRELVRLGAKEGDKVVIGKHTILFPG